ncbi:MAG: DUF1294 domain-containing protein [Eubacteriales bacterium]|nr:DUF1294 domain-containing protein [Eubacteriales bacterium]
MIKKNEANGRKGNTLMHHLFILYGIIINLLGFALMGADKRKARKHLWRIPERTLFLAALLGGAAGSIAGMYIFRHKTRHWYFVAGMPLILAAQIALYAYVRSLGG